MTTSSTVAPQGSARRYFHSLWLLSGRDLRVKYATTWLGYAWSVLDPLLMCLVYWVLMEVILQRTGGVEPFVIFLISGLLPWQWFTATVTGATTAFSKDKKLVRSTGTSNTIWVLRVVLSNGITYAFSLPILAVFLIIHQVPVGPGLWWFPVAFVLQAMLLTGLGLILAPLCILMSDLSRIVSLVVRMLFFASPILFDHSRLPEWLSWLNVANPMFGILTMYRLGYWPELWDGGAILASALISTGVLIIGIIVFPPLLRPVLKDL